MHAFFSRLLKIENEVASPIKKTPNNKFESQTVSVLGSEKADYRRGDIYK